MKQANLEKIKEERKKVSRLIFMVLAESLSVREAILRIPTEFSDSSVKAAYHALVHREADELLRKQDIAYREEQDDYLEFLAQTLDKGQELPQNIIKNYNKYYKDISVKYSEGLKDLVKRLCKFLNV